MKIFQSPFQQKSVYPGGALEGYTATCVVVWVFVILCIFCFLWCLDFPRSMLCPPRSGSAQSAGKFALENALRCLNFLGPWGVPCWAGLVGPPGLQKENFRPGNYRISGCFLLMPWESMHLCHWRPAPSTVCYCVDGVEKMQHFACGLFHRIVTIVIIEWR